MTDATQRATEPAALSALAGNVLEIVDIPELPNHNHFKVRDNYDLKDGRSIMVASDRLSAFDVHLACIPCKGQVLTQTARFWFEQTANICPNHVIEYPDPNVVVCKRLKMLPIEVVVRAYLAGTTSTSILSMYKRGQREMYGTKFPDGMRDNQKLPAAIITPTTKGETGSHDDPLSSDEILRRHLLPEKLWNEVSEKALKLFAKGQEVAEKRGLILVDTKYEFGLDENDELTLADEIHTPDSSRYWLADSYQKRFEAGEAPDRLDKDFIRTWVTARCDPYKDEIPVIPQDMVLEAAQVYIRLHEKVTGQRFELPNPAVPILERIRKNLAKYF